MDGRLRPSKQNTVEENKRVSDAIITLALPPLSAFRHQSTGAEGHLELVNLPAIVALGLISAINKSRLSARLSPADTPPIRIPLTVGKSGNDGGARGERFKIIPTNYLGFFLGLDFCVDPFTRGAAIGCLPSKEKRSTFV